MNIPKIDQWGFLDEHFLECGKDGVIRVKDGRSLEEYLNDPRLVKRRKTIIKKTMPMVIVAKAMYEQGLFNCA